MRNPSQFDMNNVQEEVRTQVGILSIVTKQVERMSKKLGQDTVYTLLKNIFENESATEAMQRNVGMSQVRRFVVYETEIQIGRE